MTAPACTHLSEVTDVTPSGNGCVECLAAGSACHFSWFRNGSGPGTYWPPFRYQSSEAIHR